jgi:hypothetical protein
LTYYFILNVYSTKATPHLGTRDFTYFEDNGIVISKQLKNLVSKVLYRTGRDLFFNDIKIDNETLLFKMATKSEFLQPLQSFVKRRLYSNLNQDFFVPIGTGAFLEKSLIEKLKRKHSSNYGIVEIVNTTTSNNNNNNNKAIINDTENELTKSEKCKNEGIIQSYLQIYFIVYNKY